MGNCQAIDSAALVIQHPNGKVDKLFSPVSAAQIMKMNPGHYVALLLTTTLYSSSAAAGGGGGGSGAAPLRVTRIKLLRSTDTLLLGHVYRLVTSQEVMKGLFAKKQAKMKQQQQPGSCSEKYYEKMMREKLTSDFEAVIKTNGMENTKKVKQNERQRSRNNTRVNSGVSKSRGWQPSLNSISEAGS
ncbi:hypothetical protein ABFS82_09G025400 [Erythranthe guttata]|uniref:Uncharacterized protein n=1 Tax=Erythranthe guttata TaxID=4155 RepID=A0A022RRC2_ERYGU|nr:PREDICTED: uncharacterized protein LOC105952202 [Erythranthe guttata]EYU42536.1 hypothetical protein MIMGU_mgv1a014563mg [Erythranthe guttata]|eukprot:XP_012831183.1 PREDICTED: uncharacterized protein LOC105952202 [Erythranthe guttata]